MSIFQNDRKIGFSYTRLAPQSAGYELEEQVLMRVTTMGMVQELRLRTRATLLADLSLERFDFEVASGRFRFTAQGERADGLLVWLRKRPALDEPSMSPKKIRPTSLRPSSTPLPPRA